MAHGLPLGATSSYLRVIAVTATQKQCTFVPSSTTNHRLSNKTGSEMRHNFGVQDWVQLEEEKLLPILCKRHQMRHLDFSSIPLLTEGLLVRI